MHSLKLYSTSIVKLMIILLGLSSLGFNSQNKNPSEKSDVLSITENYRIEVISAKSSQNAVKIAERLNEIINKPIYIEHIKNEWKIQVRGLETIEEAQLIKEKLNKIGIKNLSILKIIQDSDHNLQIPSSSFEQDLLSNDKIELYVTEISSDIKIDGRLTEPEWEKASPYTGYFYQQEPLDREPSSEKTEVRILKDQNNLIFGIRCYYTDPSKIFATVMRRDGLLMRDDFIEIFLDTYHDGRNCFCFATNPLGAKVDAVITDEGNYVNQNWDAVWYCKTSRDDEGWCAEISIPFKSLKFKEGEDGDWGINIGRNISYKREETYLVPIPRALSHRGKYRASLYANLKNIENPKTGRNLQVIPYTSGGKIYEYRPKQNLSRFNRGFDIRYNVTPNLTADFTYNTDFAQVEADQEIVNYTRFNINLPEKREFFLQSAGLFSFGSSGSRGSGGGGYGGSGGSSGGMMRSSSYLLFNSRSVGIYDGNEVPILAGLKLTGKADKYSIGLLNMQTEKTYIDDSYTEPSTNYTAVKVKRDILKNSNIGPMFLNKQNAKGTYDRAIRIDSYFSFKNTYTINGSIANNIKPDVKDKNWAGTFGASINKDWMNASISYTRLDTLFNPEMGFVRRGNIRSSSGRLGFTKWLNNRYFRSIYLGSNISYVTNQHNFLETRRNGYDLRIRFKSGEYISMGFDGQYEFLPEEDEIRGIKLDPGKYNTTGQSISLHTFSGRPISGSITYLWGGAYDGKSRWISFRNSLKISNNFNISLSYSYNNLNLKNGTAESDLVYGRFSYSFNPQLFAKYYIQWNDANNKIVGNFILDYIYRPKSHFYLVYNENRDTTYPGIKNIKDRALLIKFTYLWNI